MTVTRVSRTKRSSDCAVGTLEFELKEDSRNGRVTVSAQSDDRLVRATRVTVIFNFLSLYNLYFCSACLCIEHSRDSVKYYSHLRFFVYCRDL